MDRALVAEAFRVALSRPPSDEEQTEASRFVRQCQKAFEKEREGSKDNRTDAWASLCQALIASAEFRYLN